MGVVRGEEAVLNPATRVVIYILLLHNWANTTLGTRLASKITVNVVCSRRALDENVLHWEETLTSLGAVELMSSTSH